MKLSRETVRAELEKFAIAYGLPKHADDSEKLSLLVDVYHEALSKRFNDHTFKGGVEIAWNRARGFPLVSDFFEFGEKKVMAREVGRTG